MQSRVARWFWRLLFAAGICRLGFAWYTGLEYDRGDFYATLPGAYAKTLNPALWDSHDLEQADGYQRSEYLYGPTQYLTLFPLIFFDSYQALARFLLFFYPPVIGLAAYLMWRSFQLFGSSPSYSGMGVFASTWLFLPVLQAYGQREFEIMILFVTTCALYFLLSWREGIGGALIAYTAWFKFLPLVFLPYFVVRGWGRAVLAFALASAIILALAHTFLELPRFQPVVELASRETGAAFLPDAFCEAWQQPGTRHHAVANTTRVSVKWALCSFEDRWSWLPAQWIHAGIFTLVLAAFAVGYRRLRRCAPLEDSQERWRRSLEVGLVLMVPWLFFHAHYYYLSFAIVPLNALLVRYLIEIEAGRGWTRVVIWACAYVLLGAFVIPPSVLSHLFGVDFWQLYMQNAVYFFGEMLLLGLVLWEYLTLPTPTSRLAA